jgi:hypothetical protein
MSEQKYVDGKMIKDHYYHKEDEPQRHSSEDRPISRRGFLKLAGGTILLGVLGTGVVKAITGLGENAAVAKDMVEREKTKGYPVREIYSEGINVRLDGGLNFRRTPRTDEENLVNIKRFDLVNGVNIQNATEIRIENALIVHGEYVDGQSSEPKPGRWVQLEADRKNIYFSLSDQTEAYVKPDKGGKFLEVDQGESGAIYRESSKLDDKNLNKTTVVK